jgi:hypothetical protein
MEYLDPLIFVGTVAIGLIVMCGCGKIIMWMFDIYEVKQKE